MKTYPSALAAYLGVAAHTTDAAHPSPEDAVLNLPVVAPLLSGLPAGEWQLWDIESGWHTDDKVWNAAYEALMEECDTARQGLNPLVTWTDAEGYGGLEIADLPGGKIIVHVWLGGCEGASASSVYLVRPQ